MHLIINPSDIYYLTSVRSHDPGEILMLQSTEGVRQNSGIIFCDLRTSALFDAEKYTIIDQRAEWAENMSQFHTFETDPDYLTQTLREKIE